MMKRSALLGATLLLCGGAASAAPESVLLRAVKQGQMSGVEKPAREVARTEAEWTALWSRHSPPGPDGAPPKVDFSKEMVLAVFLGTRPSGGYSVEIREAHEEQGKLLVTVAERKPAPGSLSISVLTSPYHYAVVRKSKLPVEWKTVRETGKPK